ncbi:MAG: hypothetical protein ACT4QF_00035 [Sporichthyaceae bacterium]
MPAPPQRFGRGPSLHRMLRDFAVLCPILLLLGLATGSSGASMVGMLVGALAGAVLGEATRQVLDRRAVR